MIITTLKVTHKKTLCFDTNHKIQIKVDADRSFLSLWLYSSQKIVATTFSGTANKLP